MPMSKSAQWTILEQLFLTLSVRMLHQLRRRSDDDVEAINCVHQTQHNLSCRWISNLRSRPQYVHRPYDTEHV